jgi:NADPH-dependent 2,4-dienoyl-CoA reductase/sulfur reductase-like enzyme
MERLVQELTVSCLYNPEVGREGERSSANIEKKVMVIGGGPGGMEAAVIAATRGHRVELYEKESELGGQAILAAIPPGKEEFSAVREFLINELNKLEVAIHLNQEVTLEMVEQNQPDVVILATGALPFIPNLPGIAQDKVVTAWDVLRGKEVGQKVMVAGGELVGAETALFLAQNAKAVVLIEKLDDIASDVGPLNRVRLMEALQKTGSAIKCQTQLLGISETGAMVRDETGIHEIATDTVVLALGAKAQDSLRRDLEKICQVYAVGDCVTPRKMVEAISEAYEVAMKI